MVSRWHPLLHGFLLTWQTCGCNDRQRGSPHCYHRHILRANTACFVKIAHSECTANCSMSLPTGSRQHAQTFLCMLDNGDLSCRHRWDQAQPPIRQLLWPSSDDPHGIRDGHRGRIHHEVLVAPMASQDKIGGTTKICYTERWLHHHRRPYPIVAYHSGESHTTFPPRPRLSSPTTSGPSSWDHGDIIAGHPLRGQSHLKWDLELPLAPLAKPRFIPTGLCSADLWTRGSLPNNSTIDLLDLEEVETCLEVPILGLGVSFKPRAKINTLGRTLLERHPWAFHGGAMPARKTQSSMCATQIKSGKAFWLTNRLGLHKQETYPQVKKMLSAADLGAECSDFRMTFLACWSLGQMWF